MENAKWPIDTDDGLESESHESQSFHGHTNHLIDPFSPSPHSRSYFVDIHAQETLRPPSVNTIRPLESTIRSHPSIKSSTSYKRPRSPSPLSFLPPPYTHPSLLLNLTKPPPPEISFLDLPESKPETKRRSSSLRLLPPSPIEEATPSGQRPSRFRFKSLRRAPRRCRTVTWINSLFSPRKPLRPKPKNRGSNYNNPSIRVIPSTPNLNDVITDVMASSFSSSVLRLVNQVMGEDQKLRISHENHDIRRAGKKDEVRRVQERFGSDDFTSQWSPEAAPRVMETMRLFETELADDIVSLVDWKDFCMELLDGSE